MNEHHHFEHEYIEENEKQKERPFLKNLIQFQKKKNEQFSQSQRPSHTVSTKDNTSERSSSIMISDEEQLSHGHFERSFMNNRICHEEDEYEDVMYIDP